MDGCRVAGYMEQQCLLSELQDMVEGLQYTVSDHCRDQGVLGAAANVKDKHTSMIPSAEALASLVKHLQAAVLVQHLQLPSAAQNRFSILLPGATNTGVSDTEERHAELLGSKQHILGVTPQQVRQLAIPSRKAAQRAHASLLPMLEQRLCHNAQTSAAAITRAEPGAGQASQAVQKVKDTQAALVQLQQANARLLQELQQEAAAYLGELDGIHAALQQLVGTSILEEQPKINQVCRENMQATLQQCVSKLHMMQLVVWSDTYEAKNAAALEAISQEQSAMEQQLRSSIDQAQAELQEYEQLGDEFDYIVKEYGDAMAKIQEVDRLFDKFTELENEAAMYF